MLLGKFVASVSEVSSLLNNAWFIFNPEQGKSSYIDMNLEPLFLQTLLEELKELAKDQIDTSFKQKNSVSFVLKQ